VIMQKIMNQITKVVHIAHHASCHASHCGAYVILTTKVPIDTTVTCGHCLRIFKNDSRVVAGAKGRENILRGIKDMVKHHPNDTHAFTLNLKPIHLEH